MTVRVSNRISRAGDSYLPAFGRRFCQRVLPRPGHIPIKVRSWCRQILLSELTYEDDKRTNQWWPCEFYTGYEKHASSFLTPESEVRDEPRTALHMRIRFTSSSLFSSRMPPFAALLAVFVDCVTRSPWVSRSHMKSRRLDN